MCELSQWKLSIIMEDLLSGTIFLIIIIKEKISSYKRALKTKMQMLYYHNIISFFKNIYSLMMLAL